MAEPEAGRELRLEDRLHRSKGRAARSSIASARVTREELRELDQAAETHGKALSEWAREELLAAARRPASDPLFTEVLAGRVLLVHLLRPLLNKADIDNEWISEVMAQVRREKHDWAQEVMKQYVPEREETGRASALLESR